MSNENIDKLDFHSDDPVVEKGLKWMAEQGPIPETRQTEGYIAPEIVEKNGVSEDKTTPIDDEQLKRAQEAIDEQLQKLYRHFPENDVWDENLTRHHMRAAFAMGYNLRDKDNKEFGSQYLTSKS